jgi:hypothetical protein
MIEEDLIFVTANFTENWGKSWKRDMKKWRIFKSLLAVSFVCV